MPTMSVWSHTHATVGAKVAVGLGDGAGVVGANVFVGFAVGAKVPQPTVIVDVSTKSDPDHSRHWPARARVPVAGVVGL